jgi:subtilase family serine protease
LRLLKLTSLAALSVLAISALGAPHASALSAHNVAPGLQRAVDQGPVAPETEQTLTVILKLRNQAGFDAAVQDLYDPESASFHKWFTDADFQKYAPTAADLKIVRDELSRQGLSVVSVDPQNFSIRVHGSASTVERAFQTELHTFNYNGSNFQAHIRDAQLTGAAGELVDSVVGLDRHRVQPQLTVVKDPLTNQQLFKKKVTAADLGSTLLGEITGTPLSSPALVTLTTPGAALPLAVYYGTTYDANPKLAVSYTPAQLQSHYGLTSLIKQGYDGTGQTIALVEAYGYAAAESDANAAAKTFGLPALTSKNFSVVYPEGKPTDLEAADLTGWTGEIALDIQSAHAIAPGANIVVVASAGEDDEDQITSLQYIISNKLASTVSSSWENDSEILAGPAQLMAFSSVLERGAAAGISFQFSTGDGGDQGLGTPIGAVSVPSDSPYATAVGGTSILNNPSGTNQIVAGWGNDITLVNLGEPVDPPTSASYFYAGAGGGESLFFAKPSWQKELPGTGRQVPDVSALADPFTGFPVIETVQGTQYAEAGIGGTSLASPIFTAIWAIADQYNGKALGHAGQAVAKLKAGQITDVVGTSTLNMLDPAGTVYDANGATFYSADGLFADADMGQTQTEFPSALWSVPSYQQVVVLSFGTDSSLTVTPGWDNVTGYGEPNGLPFIQGVTGKTQGAALVK